MKEKLAKLINVKSIITFVFVFTYCIMTGLQLNISDKFSELVMIIVVFYFGTQSAEAKKLTKGDD